jgi:hypothetical protein
MRTSLTLLACLWHLATPAAAQSSNPFVFNGTVKSVDASSVSLTSEESGALNTFRLGPNLLVIRNMPASLADIKPNDFIASAAVRKTDGKLHSTELRIFPEALRGLGEGQRLMNDAQNQTMTNATVSGTAIIGGSNNIRVKFPGGESELILDSGIPVTAVVPLHPSLLKAGDKVRLQGANTSDGVLIHRITLR